MRKIETIRHLFSPKMESKNSSTTSLWALLPSLGLETQKEFADCIVDSFSLFFSGDSKLPVERQINFIVKQLMNTSSLLYYAARRRLGLEFKECYTWFVDDYLGTFGENDILFHFGVTEKSKNELSVLLTRSIVKCTDDIKYKELAAISSVTLKLTFTAQNVQNSALEYLQYIFSHFLVEQKEKVSIPLRIGVDYGGVCSIQDVKYEDGTFNEELEMNMPDCLESLQTLRSLRHQLFLISFCGAKRAAKTREYLSTINHPFDELYFVKDRRYKRDVCERLGVDLMIDDRLDVLCTLRATPTLHFGKGHITDSDCQFKPTFSAQTWKDVLALKFSSAGIEPNDKVDLRRKLY